MLRLFSFIGLILIVSVSSIAQKNPAIDKSRLLELANDKDKAQKEFSNAEKYYKKGEGTYDEALKYYLRLYEYCNDDVALNYKIGACYLGSSNKKAALSYLLQSDASIAKDYYFLLGKANQYNYKYTEAREAFEKYYALQNNWNRSEKLEQLNQLKRECIFGQSALQDSVPVFIYNLGPVMNTYYDDYGAVFVPKDSTFYYTSRRPRKEPSHRVSRFKYNEKILYSEGSFQENPVESDLLKKLNKSRHTAVAGYDTKKDRLYYYQGKERTGNIYSTEVKRGKAKKQKDLNGKINHIAYKETSLTVADDGATYFISNRRGGEGGKDIWSCKQKGKNRFSKVRNLGELINTPFDEECVYVSTDGNTLYFSSNGHEGMGGFDVFKSEKLDNGTWSAPINLGYPINTPADELFYKETENPDVALYSAVRADGYGGLDIYKIVKDKRIPFTISGSLSDVKTQESLSGSVNVFRSEDNELVASSVTDSLTNKYLLSFEDGGSYYVLVDADGYLSLKDTIICPTERHAELVMDFALEKLKSPFTINGFVRDSLTFEPLAAMINFYDAEADTLLSRQVTQKDNGKYSVTLADKYKVKIEVIAEDYFTTTDSIDAKIIDADFVKKTYDLVSSKVYYNLSGAVKNADDNQPLMASLYFYRPNESVPFYAEKSDSVGNYKVKFDEEGPFHIEARAEGYFFLNDTVRFEEADSLHKSVDFILKPMKRGAKIVVENILFNSGKATLKPSSFTELDKLATLLTENSDIKIEVSGHTDNVGSAAINKKISKARALTVRNYLVTKGVEEERLTYEGYGFDQPIANNSTAEGRAQNRRVEIKVIE